MKTSFMAGLALGLAVSCLTGEASANSLSVDYFTASGQDFGTGGSQWGTYYNEVTPNLGPNGLPVLNPAYSGYISDVNSNGEILWWSPSLSLSTTTITYTGSGTVSLPFNNNLYPPNGTGSNDSSGMQTAVFSGILNLPVNESVTFTFGADDDAFLYVDGTLISSLGGIHGTSPGPTTTSILSAGSHDLKLFFADQMYTGSQLYLSVDTQDVTTNPNNPVPEPATLLLMGTGLAGLISASRKRKA